MTTTVAWVSFQNATPSALTFASDSRLSWPNGSKWDFGRKIFWCKDSADIFGFAGDAMILSTVISQVCEIFDYSVASVPGVGAEERHNLFLRLIESASSELVGVKLNEMHVLHGARDGQAENAEFRLWRTRRPADSSKWSDKELFFQASGNKMKFDDPGPFFSAGSGAGKHRDRWKARCDEAGDTSRSVFRALMDVIEQQKDKMTGGPPQIATLGRSGVANPVGVFTKNERSVCGLRVGAQAEGGKIEWRDEEFQFLNSKTLAPKSNAAEHHFKKAR